MSEIQTGGYAFRAIRRNSDDTATLGPADWLSLAAAPAFTLMTLLTATHTSPADILCSATHEGFPLGGMTLMYLLMSIFHSPPWMRLIVRRTKRPQAARPAKTKADHHLERASDLLSTRE